MMWWRERAGQAMVMGMLAAALAILLVGAMYDVYVVYQYRTWGYQVAGEAARHGVIEGLAGNLATFYATGEPSLDAASARRAAEAFLLGALSRKGITDYSYDIRVVTDPAGGTIPGFPPVAHANLDRGDMVLGGPGVGVYLAFSVPTAWLGLIGREGYRLHVFGAAEAFEAAD